MEGLVSVGLAGIFIAILSSMLSENLRMGPATYNDLVANQILNNLEEGALTAQYESLAAQIGKSPPLVITKTGTGVGEAQLTNSKVRRIPLQIDISDPTLLWGSLDRSTHTINPNNAWKNNSGNYFRGVAYETIEDGTSETTIPSIKITYTVTFNENTGENSAGRKRKRVMYVFQ